MFKVTVFVVLPFLSFTVQLVGFRTLTEADLYANNNAAEQ